MINSWMSSSDLKSYRKRVEENASQYNENARELLEVVKKGAIKDLTKPVKKRDIIKDILHGLICSSIFLSILIFVEILLSGGFSLDVMIVLWIFKILSLWGILGSIVITLSFMYRSLFNEDKSQPKDKNKKYNIRTGRLVS